METIFQKIIKKEVPADIVYEDEHTLAFLDHNPSTKGHTLVIPKKPIADIFELDDETGTHLIKTVTKVSRAIKKATGAKGINLIVNNGIEADQEVFHIHFHIIPRNVKKEFGELPKEPYASDSERKEYRKNISKEL